MSFEAPRYYPPTLEREVWHTPMFGIALCDLCAHRNWVRRSSDDACDLRPGMLPNTHSCRLWERAVGCDDDASPA